jgi:hypothetical protein
MKYLVFIIPICLAVFMSCSKVEPVRTTSEERIIPLPFNDQREVTIKFKAKKFIDNSFKPLSEFCWADSKPPTYIKLFYRPEGDFHAAGADLGGIYAEYNNSTAKWNIKSESQSISTLGSSGLPGTPTFIKLGPNKFGFVMERGDMNMGEESSSISIYTVIGNKFKEIFSITTSEATFERSANVSIYQDIDSSKEYYDLKANLSITENYNLSPDEDLGRTFGGANKLTFCFKDSIYLKMKSNK